MTSEPVVVYPRKKATALEVVKNVDLKGKYILITGANTGIGFETARALARVNAHIIMACRRATSANEAKDKILAEKPDAEISIMKIDCSDMESVESCAEEYLKRDWPLHCLILNAGVYNPLHRITDADFEATFQINHLAQFLLTKRLEPRLIQSAPSRVVVVSSDAHMSVFLSPEKITWKNLSPTHKPKLNSAMAAYNLSKFCNIHFARELDKRLSGQGVNAYSLHPGVIKTEIGRNSGFLNNILSLASHTLGKNTEQGAATTVFLASRPKEELKGGHYYADCRPKAPTAAARNPVSSVKLWEVSEEMLDQYKKNVDKEHPPAP